MATKNDTTGLDNVNNTYKILRQIYRSGSTSLESISSTYDAFRATYDSTGNALSVYVTDSTINGDLEVTGNLIVSGATISDLNVTERFILVNSGETGSGVTAGTAGLQVDRGSGTDYVFEFQESDDTFRVGELGSTVALAGRDDTPTTSGVPYWDDTTSTFKTGSITSDGGDLVIPSGDSLILDGPTNNAYITDAGVSFLQFYAGSNLMLQCSPSVVQVDDLEPLGDSSKNLGSASKRWNNYYTDGSIYNGTTEMIDLSDTGATVVKTDLSIDTGNELILDSSNNSKIVGTTSIVFTANSNASFQMGASTNLTFKDFDTRNMYPNANNTYDLGTSAKAYRDTYLSGSIYNGATKIIDLSDTGVTAVKTDLSVEDGKIYVGGDGFFMWQDSADDYITLNRSSAGAFSLQDPSTSFKGTIDTNNLSESRIVEMPNSSGVLAVTANVSGLTTFAEVLASNAETDGNDINLSVNDDKLIIGEDGAYLTHDSNDDYITLNNNNAGSFSLQDGTSGYKCSFDTSSLLASVLYTMPDANGTIAAITASAPATAGAAGVVGQIAYDGSYIYICTASDTWLRAAIATW